MKLTIEITTDAHGRLTGLASIDWPGFQAAFAAAVATELQRDSVPESYPGHVRKVAESPIVCGWPTAEAQAIVRRAISSGDLEHWLGASTTPVDAVRFALDRLTGGARLVDEIPNDAGQLVFRCGPVMRKG